MEKSSTRGGGGGGGGGYAWAVSAGFNAALAAISTKLPLPQIIRYGMVLFFNLTMWASYVNSLKALSSLQATVTNFATNFISSGLVGFFFFRESLSLQVERSLLVLFNAVEERINRFYFVIYFGIDVVKNPCLWFAGALLIIIGVVVLSKSSIEEKVSTD